MMKFATQLFFSLLFFTTAQICASQTPTHLHVRYNDQIVGPFHRYEDTNIFLKVDAPASGFTHTEVTDLVTQQINQIKSAFPDPAPRIALLMAFKPHRELLVHSFRYTTLPQSTDLTTGLASLHINDQTE